MATATNTSSTPKKGKRIPPRITKELLSFTRHLLDQYGAENLPIIESKLSERFDELMKAIEECKKAYETKTVKPVVQKSVHYPKVVKCIPVLPIRQDAEEDAHPP